MYRARKLQICVHNTEELNITEIRCTLPHSNLNYASTICGPMEVVNILGFIFYIVSYTWFKRGKEKCYSNTIMCCVALTLQLVSLCAGRTPWQVSPF